MGKLINRIPCSRLLISSLPGLASRMHVESLGMPHDGKLDIKRPGFYRTQYPASYTHRSLGRTPSIYLTCVRWDADVFVVPFIKIPNSKVIL